LICHEQVDFVISVFQGATSACLFIAHHFYHFIIVVFKMSVCFCYLFYL